MNKEYDVIIVGGSAAGVAAAITARRHYPEKTIMVVRSQKKVPIPCGIPYIYGTVGSPDNNLIPDGVLDKNKVDLIIDEVTTINREAKTIDTKNDQNFSYQKLIIATGSNPIIPPIKGIDLDNVFSVKKDTDYLQMVLEKLKSVKDLAIIGGGFIGVEFAEECKKNRNITVSIIELMPHCLSSVYDEDACITAENILKDKGINILTNEKVVELSGDSKVKSIKLESGKIINADMVILGIGAKPNVQLAIDAGLNISDVTHAIKVDTNMRTSDSNIFACGDCAKKSSFFDGKPSALMLASIATTEARIAGANLFTNAREKQGVIGAFSTVLGDTAFAAAGITEKTAKESGYDIVVGTSEGPNRHPGKMPGMANLKVKLIFNKATMVILGGQIVGAKSGGEMINVVGACIQSKMTADEIALFQTATHPALTASPIAYQLVNAAEIAIQATK